MLHTLHTDWTQLRVVLLAGIVVATLAGTVRGRRRRRNRPAPFPATSRRMRDRASSRDRANGAALASRIRSEADFQSVSWGDFERLVAEAFRRWGYRVQSTGLGGVDGGVDLRAQKNGLTTIVQCKHWKSANVGEPQVREMFGLMHHYHVDAIAVVSSGRFTRTAWAFAKGKPIELIDGDKLARMINRQA